MEAPAHIILFGGTFDPIHAGHLRLMQAVLERYPQAQMLLSVAPHPVHKDGARVTPYKHRVKMCRLALRHQPRCALLTLEENLSGYTVDTVRELKKIYPEARLTLLIGADSLLQFHTWREPQTILALADVLTYPRPHYSVSLPQLTDHFDPVTAQQLFDSYQADLPQNDVSSTDLRRCFFAAAPLPPSLPRCVARYINKHLLYAAPPYRILKRSLRMFYKLLMCYFVFLAVGFVLPQCMIFQAPVRDDAAAFPPLSVVALTPTSIPAPDSYRAQEAAARATAERMLFQPPRVYNNEELNALKAAFSDSEFITVLHLNADSRAAGTLLYFHGNADDLYAVDKYYGLDNYKYEVYAVDYRGYGKSSPGASIEHFYEDALRAYDYLVNEQGVDPSKLIVQGHSLGCAAVLYVGAERACAGLICEAPFASLLSVVFAKNPFPFDFMVNSSVIENVTEPVLIIHGRCDEIIPFRNGVKVYRSARGPKQGLWPEKAHHNDIPRTLGEDYLPTLYTFADSCLNK